MGYRICTRKKDVPVLVWRSEGSGANMREGTGAADVKISCTALELGNVVHWGGGEAIYQSIEIG